VGAVSDTFADGIRSIVSVLRPRVAGWREVPCELPGLPDGPRRAFFHDEHSLFVISAVEVTDQSEANGPEYHLSISRQHRTLGPRRCTSDQARWVLVQFRLDGALEDNHVPGGQVRNFWRPVADNLVGRECACVADENEIREDKGDFIWRPAL
jgi:hypothetical protein